MADEVRLIDANALLKEIEEEIEAEKSYDNYEKGVTAGLRIALRDIKKHTTIEAKPVNGWISVKDKMPRLGQRVMASCRAGIMTFLRYDGEVWFEMSSRNEYLLSFVTHWRHLPKPPKGE